jgi:hypothetical protein
MFPLRRLIGSSAYHAFKGVARLNAMRASEKSIINGLKVLWKFNFTMSLFRNPVFIGLRPAKEPAYEDSIDTY